MWHSIPAALIAGLATFLICLSPELEVRFFKAWAIVVGFVSHLILDEVYAVDWSGKKIRIKKSFGTAMKWFSSSTAANISAYGQLALLVLLALSDSSLMEYIGQPPLEITHTANDWIKEQIDERLQRN